MAVAHPLHIHPAHPPAQPDLAKHFGDIDVELLCAKLAVAKREQDAARWRQLKREALQSGSGGYFPCSAADQFLSTTTNNHAAYHHSTVPAPTKTGSGRHRRPSHPTTEQKARFTADGKPCPDPKRLYAALGTGSRPESEPRRSGSDADRVRRSGSKDGAWRATPDVLATDHEHPALDAPIVHVYRAGDATKRRQDAAAQQKSRYVRVKNGSMTAYERADGGPEAPDGKRKGVPTGGKKATFNPYTLFEDEDGQPLFPANHNKDSSQQRSFSEGHVKQEGAETPPRRPRVLDPHDRPHWAQQSECGEGMRRVLGFNLQRVIAETDEGRASKQRTTAAGDGGGEAVVQRGQRRQASMPDTLASNAVWQIKSEQTGKKRQSVMNFFKRS